MKPPGSRQPSPARTSPAARNEADLDEELSRLRRAFDADPTDPAAAARLERALLRAGESARAVRLYQQRLRCPLAVDELDGPSRPWAKRCGRCARPVHLATNLAEAVDLLADGLAAAVRAEWVDDVVAHHCAGGVPHPRNGQHACVVTISEAQPRPPSAARSVGPTWGWSHDLPPARVRSPFHHPLRRPRADTVERAIERTAEELRELAQGVTRPRHLRSRRR